MPPDFYANVEQIALAIRKAKTLPDPEAQSGAGVSESSAEQWVNEYFIKRGRPNVTANMFTYERLIELMAAYAAYVKKK
jgi:hypothetical protein